MPLSWKCKLHLQTEEIGRCKIWNPDSKNHNFNVFPIFKFKNKIIESDPFWQVMQRWSPAFFLGGLTWSYARNIGHLNWALSSESIPNFKVCVLFSVIMLRKNQTTVVRLLLSNLDYLLRLYQTIRILTNVCAIFFISLPLHFGLLIGTYFWEHIFESTLQQQSEAWSYGEVDLEDVSLRFLLFGCCILILFTLTLSFL